MKVKTCYCCLVIEMFALKAGDTGSTPGDGEVIFLIVVVKLKMLLFTPKVTRRDSQFILAT